MKNTFEKYDEIGNQYIIEAETQQEADIIYQKMLVNEIDNSYRKLREEAYLNELGNWQDQMDMIYWDDVNDTTIWKDKIAEIKNRYPKDL